jgi:hypothetical protein
MNNKRQSLPMVSIRAREAYKAPLRAGAEGVELAAGTAPASTPLPREALP